MHCIEKRIGPLHVWGVIPIKNKSLIMIFKYAVLAFKYSIVIFNYAVLTFKYSIVVFKYAVLTFKYFSMQFFIMQF